MSIPQRLTDGSQTVREYVKGVDRATAIRRLFAFWMVFTIVVSLVPPGVLYLGGPDLSPVGVASAAEGDEIWNNTTVGTPNEFAVDESRDRVYMMQSDGTVTAFDETTHKVVWNYTQHTNEGMGVTVKESSGVIFSVAKDNEVHAIYSNGTNKWTYTGHTNNVIDVFYDDDRDSVYTVSHDGTVHSIDVSDGSKEWSYNDGGSLLSVGADTADGVVYYGDNDGDIAALYANNGTLKWGPTSIHGSTNNVWDIQVRESTDVLYSASADNTVQATYTSNRSQKWSHTGHTDQVKGLALDIGARVVYSAGKDGKTQSLHIANGTQDVLLNNFGSSVRGIAVNTSSTTAYTGSGGIYAYEGSTSLPTVSGTITYASNGTAIEGASITVNDSSVSDTTDASGGYSVTLSDGDHKITATKGDLSNSITVTVSGSDLTNQNITLTDETLSLDVPTHMFPNETASYEVTLEGSDVTDQANVTSSDPTNLTVNETSHELEATSNTDFAAEVTITAEHDGLTAERNVTVANLSADNVGLMQNAADMTAAIWGDVQGPDGTRPGGTQLTMRVLFVALLIGAAIATHASGFAGIGGITLVVVMGWFMGWVTDGMALVTVFTGLFIGLNLAANIDYSVRK